MSLLQSLDEELICAVCLEFYETPLLLPCGHNFCKNCLVSIEESGGASFSYMSLAPVSSLSCPVCKASVNLKKTGINQLPINRVLESIISLYKKNSAVDVFDGAWNSDMDIQVRQCPVHSIPADRYCESCNVAMCTKCEDDSHKKTQGRHRVESLKQMATKYQADIANSLTQLKTKNVPLNGRIQHLQDVLDRVDKNEQAVLKELTEGVSGVMSTIRQRQDELHQQVEKDVTDLKLPILEQMKKCEGLKTMIQELMKKLSAIKKTKNAVLKIKLMKDVRKQLANLLNVDIPLNCQQQTISNADSLQWELQTAPFLDHISSLQWNKIDVSDSKPAVSNAATQTVTKYDDNPQAFLSPVTPALSSKQVKITSNAGLTSKKLEKDLAESTPQNIVDDKTWLTPTDVNYSKEKQLVARPKVKPIRRSKELHPKKNSSAGNLLKTTDIGSCKTEPVLSDTSPRSTLMANDSTEFDYLNTGNMASNSWTLNSKTIGDGTLSSSLGAISICKKGTNVRNSYPPDQEKSLHHIQQNDYSFNCEPDFSLFGKAFGDKNHGEASKIDKTSEVLATFVARRKTISPSKSPSRSRLDAGSLLVHTEIVQPKATNSTVSDCLSVNHEVGSAVKNSTEVATSFTKLFKIESPPDLTGSCSVPVSGATCIGLANALGSAVDV